MAGGHTLAARTQTRAATAAATMRGCGLLNPHNHQARPGLAWASSGSLLLLHSNGRSRSAAAPQQAAATLQQTFSMSKPRLGT